MNFGVRLPGPFRVGISSKGRLNAGVTVGPFSASGGLGGGHRTAQGTLFPVTLEQFIAQAQAEGFKIEGVTPNTSATISRGWKAGVARVVPGQGVMLRQTMSARTMLTIIGSAVLLVLCCCGPTFYEMASR